MSDLFNRPPDFTYTTEQATADGELVDLRINGMNIWLDRDVTGDHNAQQVTHVSKALWRALSPDARVAAEQLEFAADQARDFSEATDEPAGQFIGTKALAMFGNEPVWFERNGQDTWTALFPSDH